MIMNLLTIVVVASILLYGLIIFIETLQDWKDTRFRKRLMFRWEFRSLGVSCKWMVSIVPSIFFQYFDKPGLYRYTLGIVWMNWSLGYKWSMRYWTYEGQLEYNRKHPINEDQP